MEVGVPKGEVARGLRSRNLAAAGLALAVAGSALSLTHALDDSALPRLFVVGGVGLLVACGLLWRLALPDPRAVNDPATDSKLPRQRRFARIARYCFRLGFASLLVSLVGMMTAPIPIGRTFGYTNPRWGVAAGISFYFAALSLPVSLWANGRARRTAKRIRKQDEGQLPSTAR